VVRNDFSAEYHAAWQEKFTSLLAYRIIFINLRADWVQASTGQKVKIVKTWGKDLVVKTPTGSKCLPKWKLTYIPKDEGVASTYPIAHYKGSDKAVYVMRHNDDNTYECVSMDGKDIFKLSKEYLEFEQ